MNIWKNDMYEIIVVIGTDIITLVVVKGKAISPSGFYVIFQYETQPKIRKSLLLSSIN